MPIRPLAPVNLQAIDNVDDALALLDVGLAELAEMASDQTKFGTKEVWMLDKNILSMKSRYDKVSMEIRRETQT